METVGLINKKVRFLTGALVGFGLFWLTSHSQSPVHKRIPARKVRAFHILPHIKVIFRKRVIHFHHWFNLSLLYAILFVIKRDIIKQHALSGLFVGSILQGLLYKDCFSFVYPDVTIAHDE